MHFLEITYQVRRVKRWLCESCPIIILLPKKHEMKYLYLSLSSEKKNVDVFQEKLWLEGYTWGHKHDKVTFLDKQSGSKARKYTFAFVKE